MISPVNPSKAPRRPSTSLNPRRVALALAVAGGLLAALTALSLRDGCANPDFARYGGLTDCAINNQ